MSVPVEERFALEDLATAYCFRVDALDDLQALLDLFTDDAILDISDIGLARMQGKEEITQFYIGVFNDMTHHQHYVSNFRIESYAGEQAVFWVYVNGLGQSHDGNTVDVHVRYRVEAQKQGGQWRLKEMRILTAMPMPASLTEIHADRT
jgi:ketosteroid isomerase-like protein